MRFSIQHGLTACNVRLSAPCVAGHAPKLTINGTAFTVATVRIVGYSEVTAQEPSRKVGLKPACSKLALMGLHPRTEVLGYFLPRLRGLIPLFGAAPQD